MPPRHLTHAVSASRSVVSLLALAFAAGVSTTAHTRPEGPRPERRLVGAATTPTPAGLTAKVRARASLLAVGDVPTDRDGATWHLPATLDTQFRVRADYKVALDTAKDNHLSLAYEHDLWSGVVSGGATFDGIDAPYSRDADEHELRVASLRLTLGEAFTFAAGAMTSHWGLGLLANDGAHGYAPGSALFSDPRGGDRVLRALLGTGFSKDLPLFVFAAADKVLGDDVLILDDKAHQFVAGAMYGRPTDSQQVGLYAVVRSQEARDGDKTKVNVVDLYARTQHELGSATFRAELEAALIFGTTDLAPTPDHPSHDVLQFGAAARLGLDLCAGGFALDVLFASGDAAFDDDTQSGFRADRNFDLGLLMNDMVLAARTSRTPIRAADPELVGVPSEDLDRLPTRGSATNTLSFFPRAWYRPIAGLELYGGLLVALSASDESDAFNARLEGGAPTNALGGESSLYLATEIDLGVRAATLLWGTRLELGLEGAVLFPASGLSGPDGLGEDPILGGRAILTYEL
jgi:hypothetical protein